MLKDFFASHSEEPEPDESALLDQLESADEDLSPSRRAAPPTRVGDDVRMEGRLVSRGSIHIEGSLVGDVSSAGTIVVEPKGRVAGDLAAVDVVVNGRVSGNIRARRRLELAAGAQLSGRLLDQPEVLVVHEKAHFGEGS